MRDPVQAGHERERKTRPSIRDCDVDRTRVGKHGERVPRKAAIAWDAPVP